MHVGVFSVGHAVVTAHGRWLAAVLACGPNALLSHVSAAALWAIVTARALRRFPVPPEPSAHSAWHRRFGKLAALDMLGTAITGWIFYWMAFVA